MWNYIGFNAYNLLGAATINDGVISIEPTSRNLIIFSHSDNQTISVRGPYFIDSAIENETDILRIPSDALATMQIDVGGIRFK